MDHFHNYRDFLDYMYSHFDEEQQITIENFMSYYINEYRGFGNKNCREELDEEIKNDKNGVLHKFALIGFEFEKKIHDERKTKALQKGKNKK